MLALIFSLTLGPILAVAFYSFLKYRYSKGYFGLLFRSYIWGFLSTLIAFLLFYITYVQGYTELKNLRRILFYSFFIIGFGQELAKFIILRYLILPSKLFKSPSDGISYSLMIFFGAITSINLAFFFFYPEPNYNILISNVFLGTVYAVIMGFFVGMGKARNNRMIDSLTGLFGASFFHGSYEFIVQTNDKMLIWPFLIGSGIITLLLIIKSIHISDELS